jgi:ABC-2 type transport system permease protein/lipopolysaccharide transport system permease protein
VAVALTLSVLTVYLRDLRQAVPILLQLGLFATPVAYGIETIPHGLRGVYSFLNPLAPVIDGYRRALFEGQAPQGDLLASGVAGTALFLAVAYPLFKRLEMGIADVA